MMKLKMSRRRFLFAPAMILGTMTLGTMTLGLSACATTDPIAGPVPQVGFAHLPPITFNVARVDVASSFKSSMITPNAEHRLPAPPERALFDWALARLKSSGGAENQTIATFVIEDASVLETKLEKTKGFTGLFTYEAAERYDARAVATMSIKDPVTGASGNIRVTATRSIEVGENATLAEREQAWVELVENLMADFNAQMEIQTQAHLSPWLVR